MALLESEWIPVLSASTKAFRDYAPETAETIRARAADSFGASSARNKVHTRLNLPGPGPARRRLCSLGQARFLLRCCAGGSDPDVLPRMFSLIHCGRECHRRNGRHVAKSSGELR